MTQHFETYMYIKNCFYTEKYSIKKIIIIQRARIYFFFRFTATGIKVCVSTCRLPLDFEFSFPTSRSALSGRKVVGKWSAAKQVSLSKRYLKIKRLSHVVCCGT